MTLPTARMLAGVIAVGAGVVAAGWPVARLLRPAASDAVWQGAAPTAFVVGLGVLMVKPWKARKVMEWPMALFGVQGLTLFGAGALGAVVYSQVHPDPIGFASALMVTFVGCWVVVAKVFSRALAPPTPSAAAPPG